MWLAHFALIPLDTGGIHMSRHSSIAFAVQRFVVKRDLVKVLFLSLCFNFFYFFFILLL